MSASNINRPDIQEQMDRARQQFESQLIKLELSKEQIERQNVPELERSLQTINDALQHPESFGVIKLKMVADLGLVVVKAGTEAHYEIGIVPLLLERKKLVLDRIQQLKGELNIENLKVSIQNVPEDSVRENLEKQLDDLKAEAARLNQQTKEVEQARMQEQLNSQEKLRRLEQEMSERKAKTWQSFFRRELMATIVGSVLLLILATTQLIAMFRQIQTTEIINNAFLIILGYFFGQTVSRPGKDEGS
jgi:Fe2+ transport system protein B